MAYPTWLPKNQKYMEGYNVAIKEGYTDEQIKEHLRPKLTASYDTAINEGWTPDDIKQQLGFDINEFNVTPDILTRPLSESYKPEQQADVERRYKQPWIDAGKELMGWDDATATKYADAMSKQDMSLDEWRIYLKQNGPYSSKIPFPTRPELPEAAPTLAQQGVAQFQRQTALPNTTLTAGPVAEPESTIQAKEMPDTVQKGIQAPVENRDMTRLQAAGVGLAEGLPTTRLIEKATGRPMESMTAAAESQYPMTTFAASLAGETPLMIGGVGLAKAAIIKAIPAMTKLPMLAELAADVVTGTTYGGVEAGIEGKKPFEIAEEAAKSGAIWGALGGVFRSRGLTKEIRTLNRLKNGAEVTPADLAALEKEAAGIKEAAAKIQAETKPPAKLETVEPLKPVDEAVNVAEPAVNVAEAEAVNAKNLETLKQKFSSKQRVAPELLDMRQGLAKEVEKIVDPKQREKYEKLLKLASDNEMPDVMRFQALDETIKYLTDNKIPFAYGRVDLGNLGGANVKLGHGGANEKLKSIWNDLFAKEIQGFGGAVGRGTGDELKYVMPHYTSAEAKEITDNIAERIWGQLRKDGLAETPHPKHGGLKTGALYPNYGVTDAIPDRLGQTDRIADELAELMAREHLAKKAKEQGFVLNKKGQYEPGSKNEKVGPVGERAPVGGSSVIEEGTSTGIPAKGVGPGSDTQQLVADEIRKQGGKTTGETEGVVRISGEAGAGPGSVDAGTLPRPTGSGQGPEAAGVTGKPPTPPVETHTSPIPLETPTVESPTTVVKPLKTTVVKPGTSPVPLETPVAEDVSEGAIELSGDFNKDLMNLRAEIEKIRGEAKAIETSGKVAEREAITAGKVAEKEEISKSVKDTILQYAKATNVDKEHYDEIATLINKSNTLQDFVKAAEIVDKVAEKQGKTTANAVRDTILQYAKASGLAKDQYETVASLINKSKNMNDFIKATETIDKMVGESKGMTADAIRDTIYRYSRAIGLDREANNRIDTLIKNSKSMNDFIKALDIMDNVLATKYKRNAVTTLNNLIKNERARLATAESTANRSSVSHRQNMRLKEYVDNLTKMPEEKAAEINKTIEYIAQNPDAVVTPEMAKNMLEVSKRNINTMSTEEIQQVVRDIKEIKSQGYLKRQLEKKQEERLLASKNRLIVQQAGAGKIDLLKQATTPTNRLKELVKNIGYGVVRPGRLIGFLTGDAKNSVLKREVYDKSLDSAGKEILGMDKAINKIADIHKNVHNGEDKLITINGNDLTVNNGMHVYAHSKDPDSYAHLIGTGLTEKNIDDIISALPKDNKKAVEGMWNYFDTEEWGRLNKAFIKEHQVELPRNKYHMPIRGLVSGNPESAIMMDIMTRYGAGRAGLEKGFLKSRVHSSSPFARMDYFGTVGQHVADVEHYLAYNDFISNAKKILGDKGVKEALMAKDPNALKELNMWIDRITIGKERSEAGAVDKISDYLRTNSSMSILGGLVSAVLKQPASLFNGIAYIKPTYTLKAAKDFMRNPFKINELINSKDPLMLGRTKNYERELAEIGEKRTPSKMFGAQNVKQGIKQGVEKLQEKSMVPMAALDKSTADIVWYGKYLEVLNDTGNEAQAIKEARELVTRTQSMGGIVHAARSFTGGGVNRAFSTFLNQPNQNLNLMIDIAKDSKTQSAGKTSAQMFANFFAPVVVTYLASNGYDPKKISTDLEGFAEEGISNIVSGVPFFGIGINYAVRQAMNKVREAYSVKPKQGNLDLTPVSFGAAKDISDVVRGSKPVEGAVNLAGKVLGIPTKQAITTIKGAKTAWETKSIKPLLFTQYALRDTREDEVAGKAHKLNTLRNKHKEYVTEKDYPRAIAYITENSKYLNEDFTKAINKAHDEISKWKKLVKESPDKRVKDLRMKTLQQKYDTFNRIWDKSIGGK